MLRKIRSCLHFAKHTRKNLSDLNNNQDGNIFFMLFGAVAIVGLLGTAVMSTMRGPLSTMVEIQSRTQAESEMGVASHLALLEATELANAGDCDGDGFVEPLEFADAGGLGPVGGGFLPNDVASSRVDPWGTEYGYCAWDAGVATGTIGCDIDANGTNNRLDGNGNPTDETYTVIAIVSAGPDQVFSTTCIGGANPSISKTGDDMVVEFTYASANAASNGLWNLKSGDPTTAEINKNLEITGTAAFSENASFSAGIDLSASTAALTLGAASMLFPNETTLTTCNGANVGLIRINTGADPDFLELCDASNGWVAIGGNLLWSAGAGNDIYYNTGTTPQVGIGKTDPSEALDVVGNIDVTGNLDAGGNLIAGGDADITGALETGGNFTASGNADITGTLDVTGTTTLSVLNASGAVDFDSTFNADGATTLGSTLDAQGDITNSTGNVTIDKDTDIEGSLDVEDVSVSNNLTVEGAISNPSGNLSLSDDVDIANDLDVTGDIVGENITVKDKLYVGVGTDLLGPALHCISTRKLEWNDGSGWSCVTDLQGGGGGGIPALNDLTDVGVTTPADGECLVYDNSSGEWGNAPCIGTGAGIFEIVSDVIRVKSSAGNYTNDDFIVGSPTLGYNGNINHGNRMFFDKSKGAFRSGRDTGSRWNDANIGLYSVAFGVSTGASGGQSLATGLFTWAGGANSVALGEDVTASADNTIGFGLGTAAGTNPVISGASSFGIFMGDQSGVDLSVANRMGLYGGDLLIDDDGTSGSQGCIQYNGTTSELEFSDDCATFTAFSNGSLGLWRDLTGGRIHYGTTSANQVGIGTSNPQTTLDVNGGVRVGSVSGGAAPTFMAINDLSDVIAAAPSDGDCLVYNNASGNWENVACSSIGVGAINDLSDAYTDYVTDFNMYMGDGAGASSSPGQYNLALGQNALASLDGTCTNAWECDYNIAVGHSALTANTLGSRNVAIGAEALQANTTGQINVAIGYAALASNTVGSANYYSGNVAVGAWALTNADQTELNVAIGARTLESVTNASGGSYNTGVGGAALGSVTTGLANIGLGHSAGSNITTGNRNIMIGAQTAASATNNDQLNIGDVITGDMATGDIAIIGTAALAHPSGTTAQRPSTGVNGMIRYNSTLNEFEGYENGSWVSMGGSAGAGAINDLSDAYTDYVTDYNIFLGTGVGGSIASGGTSNVGLGIGTLTTLSTGDNNVAIGRNVMPSITTGLRNVGIGSNALNNLGTGFQGGNVAVGMDALSSLSAGDNNTAVGDQALAGLSGNQNQNTALGNDAGLVLASGQYNVILGDNAAVALTSGSNNIFVGQQAGDSQTAGSDNIVIGYDAQLTNLTGSDQLNIGNVITGDMATGDIAIIGTSALAHPSGTTAQRPSTGVNGMIRYNSTLNEFEGYENGAWTSMGSGAGASLWTDNTTHISRESFHILNAGLAAGSTTAGLDGDGTYAFYDPDKGAFRGGAITGNGSAWQDTNIGTNSFAWGENARASGINSIAMGNGASASGLSSIALGNVAGATAQGGVALGSASQAGYYAFAAIGGQATGSRSVSIGTNSRTTSAFGVSLGTNVRSGNGTISSGFGDGSFAFGLIDDAVTITTRPQVTGIQSFGIFMGDQDGGVDLTDANTMLLAGGKFVIDPAIPATQLTARSVLDIGAATDSVVLPSGTTAQRPSTGVNGMIRYNSTTNELEGYENGSWGSMGGSATVSFPIDVEGETVILEIGTGNIPVFVNAEANENVFIGYGAGESVTPDVPTAGDGESNTFMGFDAGNSTTTGAWNSFFGREAGKNNTTGEDNTHIGDVAGRANTTADGRTMVGAGAGYGNSGATNTFVGAYAGFTNSSGTASVLIGHNAGRQSTSASRVVMLGNLAGRYATANDNTLIGYQSGQAASGVGQLTGTDNTFLGYQTGMVTTSGADNVFIGDSAAIANTTGTDNVFVGSAAGDNNTTGARNIIIGSGTDNLTATTNDYINLGNTIFGDMGTNPTTPGTGDADITIDGDLTVTGTISGGAALSFPIDVEGETVIMEIGSDNDPVLVSAFTNDNLFLGQGAGASVTPDTPSSGDGKRNTFFGQSAGTATTSGQRNTYIGLAAGDTNTTGDGNTAIGRDAGGANITGDNNVYVGSAAGLLGSSASNQTMIGAGAGVFNNGSDSTFYGNFSGYNNTGSNSILVGSLAGRDSAGASNAIIIGYSAGRYATANDNTLIGYQAGQAATGVGVMTGTDNTFVGYQTGMVTTSGEDNVFIGDSAGVANTTGDGNSFIGANAGIANTTGIGNVFIGVQSGEDNISGITNVYIGAAAGQNKASGDNNTLLGENAGSNSAAADNTVMIGSYAGDYATANDNVYIGFGSGAAKGGVENTGTDNTFVGYNTGNVNTSGTNNTLMGDHAGRINTTGTRNVFIGSNSGFNNITGNNNAYLGTWAGLEATGSTNTFLGDSAGAENTGSGNTTVGYQAGYYATASNNTLIGNQAGKAATGVGQLTGTDNTFVGYRSGYVTTSGLGNTFIGDSSGTNNTTGARNIIIGAGTDNLTATTNDYLNIGDVIIGDMSTGNIQVVGTAALTNPSGTTAQRPSTGVNGMIRYNSTLSKFEAYENSSWINMIGATGGLWTDNTTHITRENFHILDAGLAAGSTTAGLDGDGTYSFYDPDKGTMRGGLITSSNDAWEDTNVGVGSFAWGENAEASGEGSAAFGEGTRAASSNTFAAGFGTSAAGAYSTAFGYSTNAYGTGSFAAGYQTTASGTSSFAFGNTTGSFGENSIATGRTTIASGLYSTAMGYEATAGSGTGGDGDGDSSFAIGLQTAAQATNPIITGDRSMVLYMDGGVANANSAYDFTASDKFAIIGGEFQIDDVSSSANKGCIRYNSATTEIQYSHNCSTYVTMGSGGGGLWTDNTTHISRSNFHVLNTGLAAGSTTAGLDGNGSYAFFDPDKGSFRGGTISGGVPYWQDVNIGTNSFAFGVNTRASGTNSVAFGGSASASGNYGAAFGNTSSASGDASFATGFTSSASGSTSFATGYATTASSGSSVSMGAYTTASGATSIAMGRNSTADGESSIAMGLTTIANNPTTAPIVSGDESFGIFMGNQTGIDLTDSNTMAVLGGDFIVGSYQLNDTATTNQDYRMFFDVSKGALRAGLVTGTQWDGANVGDNSFANGENNTASGEASIATGWQSVASGQSSEAMGSQATASGRFAIAMGKSITASGEGSAAFGLTTFANIPGTAPIVSGDESIGFFMGNQSGVNVTATNVMAIMGGRVGINTVAPDASSTFDITSTTHGFLPPRMTTTQRDSINSGTFATGLTIYNTTTNTIQYYDGSAWQNASAAGALAINDLSDAAKNLTSNNLFLAHDGGSVGATDNFNTVIGIEALDALNNSGADNNIAIGYQALTAVNNGNDNIAIGYQALSTTTNSSDNIAIGSEALLVNSSGDRNIAMGSEALVKNTLGDDNIALGDSAMEKNTSGNDNIAIGSTALGDNINGDSNIAIGIQALEKNTDGDDNIAIGDRALTGAENSQYSVAIGVDALGDFDGASSTYNTAIGYRSLRGPSNGGTSATGIENTALGANAGLVFTTGENNVFIGYNAGNSVTTGSDNIIIGHDADTPTATTSNHLNIGNTIYGDLANGYIGIGTANPTDILTIVGDGQDIHHYSYSNTPNYKPDWYGYRARGTEASPSAVQDNDELAGIGAFAYDGNSWERTGQILFEVNGSVADQDVKTDLVFKTGNNESSNAERMRITAAGYVGIGNASPDTELDVTGSIEYSGTLTDVSDRRLKDNIKPLGQTLDRIAQIDTYSFTMKEDKKGRTEFGVIAQELETIFPTLVHTAKDEMGTKSVNYVGLIAPIIEATKELRAENAALKAELSGVRTAQAQTTQALTDLSQQVALLNKMAGNNVGKASMMPYLMLLFGLLGGMGFMLLIQRKQQK